MRVAIIGAGIAGLSCAHELEKYGITPVIYERNSYIGEQISHVAAVLDIVHRPVRDFIKYIKVEYDIQINPLNICKELVHYSPGKTTVLKGNFGYFLKRGKEQDDLKVQIYNQLKGSKVLFNTYGDYKTLSKEYDYVVIATGNNLFTEEIGCWKYLYRAFERGALILGNFNPTALHMYLNRDYCKNGYAYMIPFDKERAFVTLIVSDVNEKEVEHYWHVFKSVEDITYPILEEFNVASQIRCQFLSSKMSNLCLEF